jgi:hypothetical protein
MPGVIAGKGTVTCSGAADLSITTCLDFRSDSNSSWVEAVCEGSNRSGAVTLEREASVGCTSSDRDYQLRVSGSANGQALTAVASGPALKPSCR